MTADVPGTYADFYEQAESIFTSPEGLRGHMQTFTRLRELTAVPEKKTIRLTLR
jgi:hypothetical protein